MSDPEPRMPERTRILRPSLWIDPATAELPAEAFRLYLGLATCCDDTGWLLWRPDTLAAQLYRYAGIARRQRTLRDAAAKLTAAGLLTVHECGCAELPYMVRDLRVAGGNHTARVREWHTVTHVYVQVRTSTASDSVSVSDSVSGSSGDGPSNDGPERGRSLKEKLRERGLMVEGPR